MVTSVTTRLRHPFVLLLAALLALSLPLAAVSAARASVVALLSDLSSSTVSFDSAFAPEQTTYRATVPNTVTSFTFTPTAADPSYTLAVYNGMATVGATSGVPITVDLRPGTNTFTVTVADSVSSNTSSQYAMLITRSAPPAPLFDPRLSSLSVLGETLSPTFDPTITSYTVAVPYTTTSATVSATAGTGASAGAVTITNPSRPMTDGTTRLGIGGNLVQVTVTAIDGTTTRTYNVSIVRDDAPTANVDLDALTLSVGALAPAFDPAVTRYTATVPYAVRQVQLTASPAEAANTMVINNVQMDDGVPSTVPVIYNGGSSFAIRVTAPNQVEKIYTVQITREPPSTNADLTALSLSEGTLAPVFDNATTAYAAEVPYLTTSVTVTGEVADATAILRVNGRDTASGAASAPVALRVGDNAIVVSATAEDGVTATTRTITVTRAAPDLDLANLAVTATGGTLAPVFDAATTAYTLDVPYTTTSIDVAAAAVESAWTVAIDGVTSASRTLPLAVGTQSITVRVTAAYGETRDYVIAVTRAPAVAPTLTFSLGFGAGDVAAGAPFTVGGDHLLPGSTFTVTAYSNPVVLVTGLVGPSGIVSWNGALPASLEAGAHRLVFDGTAEDGTAVSRTAWFTLLRNGTIGAVSLTGPVAYDEAAPAAALASTGADGAGDLALVALALLALGAAALLRTSLRTRRARA